MKPQQLTVRERDAVDAKAVARAVALAALGVLCGVLAGFAMALFRPQPAEPETVYRAPDATESNRVRVSSP